MIRTTFVTMNKIASSGQTTLVVLLEAQTRSGYKFMRPNSFHTFVLPKIGIKKGLLTSILIPRYLRVACHFVKVPASFIDPGLERRSRTRSY